MSETDENIEELTTDIEDDLIVTEDTTPIADYGEEDVMGEEDIINYIYDEPAVTGEGDFIGEDLFEEEIDYVKIIGGEAATGGLELLGEGEQSEQETIYDSSTFISQPYQSEFCTIPINILEFDFSLGYTARKHFNLAMPDPDNLLFSSGNYIHIFNVPNSEISFRRTALGGGIGHIRINPNLEYPHVAVAENGNKYGKKPIVIIYEWPTMEIICVLKGGSTKIFTNLDYSPDGMLIVSQAGDPDYLITIYDWPKHKILLRTKSYVNDVYRVKFSEYVPGQLSTAGVAHIKFWKMCTTFTGLKLKGEVGRFGKTEYSDIVGIIPMPDEKVISGCTWGNLLVWEAGLIKVEVMRTNRKSLHEGPVVQIFFNEGELWTVSTDGHIKVWWYEKIDQADPPDTDRTVQMEPSYDFYTAGLMIMSIHKRYSDPESFQYFAQDGNGGIWLLDLNVYDTPEDGVRLYSCHAGEVMDIAASPFDTYLITLGRGGKIYIYDYIMHKMVYEHPFPARGSCFVWIPPAFFPTADEIFFGFDDGTIRVAILHLGKKDKIKLDLIQVIKPHSKSVTVMSINPSGKVLVTGGADDIIFILKMDYSAPQQISLIPIGFIPARETPSCLTWKPGQEFTLAVGCIHGPFFEVDVPSDVQNYTGVSYLLKAKPKHKRFTTYKSQIRRDILISQIEARKAAKVEVKRVEMEKLKKENPGMDIDEEIFLADSESEEVFEPLFIPDIPSDILWMQYTPEGTLWLSMTGYDAGYIYEYTADQPDDIPQRYTMIYDADDTEISSYIYNYNHKYLIFAMEDGVLRVNKTIPWDFRDLSDYWCYAMHENLQGFVPKMAFSFDERFFFSCGHDGNVFVYRFNPESNDYVIPKKQRMARTRTIQAIKDKKRYDVLSLEEEKIKAEKDRIQKRANDHKKAVREMIANLTKAYTALLVRNQNLPESQIIKHDHLEVDRRVTLHINTMLERKLALVRRKQAYELTKVDVLLQKLKLYYLDRMDYYPITVQAFLKDTTITGLRQKRLSPALFHMQAFINFRIQEADAKGRLVERAAAPPKVKVIKKKKAKELEYFLLNLSQSTLDMKLDAKFTRLLNKYRTRRAKWENRQEQWEEFMALEPVKGENHPDDVIALRTAEQTIGDYKLKTSLNYKVPYLERETTLKKYRQLLLTRRKQYRIRHQFSEKVHSLREEKEKVREKISHYEEQLRQLHAEIPEVTRKFGPKIPPLDLKAEYPERVLNGSIEEDEEELSEQEAFVTEYVQQFVEAPNKDRSEREVLLGLTGDQNLEDFFQDEEFLQRSKAVCRSNINELMQLSKKSVTPWELEMRAFRLNRNLFQQEDIIQNMHDEIEDFDDKLEHLHHKRAQALVNGLFIDLFLHTLHQELKILKDFEAHEEVLSEKVNLRMTHVMDMQDMMDDVKNNIEVQNGLIEKNQELEKVIQEQFLKSVHDHKFQDFLKKVFKKKYKPPKVRRGDESSSESSSSSSSESEEEDDTKSIDSRDFGIIKQDLNICPKGCDQEIFDNTIALRSKRHQVEISTRECQRVIEIHKKDLELHDKKLKIMSISLQQSQTELELFQREKQQKLNDVDCTVILNLDQLQHFKNESETCDIKDCLVFSKSTLTKLYKRVGELQLETMKLQLKHMTNVKHLTRMRTDLKYMNMDIKKLKTRIIELYKLKFGKTVPMATIDDQLQKKTFGDDLVNELQEAILRKMVNNLRFSLLDIKSLYTAEINLWQKRIETTEIELLETIKENTAKLDLLGVLKKEKQELLEQISNQDKQRANIKEKEDNSFRFTQEMEKLKAIVKEQKRQIEEMRKEIRILKTKGLHPVTPRPKDETEEEIARAKAYLYPGEGEDESESIEVPCTCPQRTPEDDIKDILRDMLKQLNVHLEKVSVENFVKNILAPLVKYGSMQDIVKEMIKHVIPRPKVHETKILETTAEVLKVSKIYDESDYMFVEPGEEPKEVELTKSEIKLYVGIVIDDIIHDIIDEELEFHISVCNVMKRVVEEIPFDFLKCDEALDIISSRIAACECASKDSIDKVKMAEVLEYWDECMCSSKDTIDKVKLAHVEPCDWQSGDPFKMLVSSLLDRVFAIGIDYISFIKR